MDTGVQERSQRRRKGRHGLGHIYEHNGAWWLDWHHHNKRRRVKLGLVKLLEKREARQIADERIKDILMPKPETVPEKGIMPFPEFAKKFVAWASSTKRSWQRYQDKKPDQTPLRYAVNFFGETPLKDITPARVEDFRMFLLNHHAHRRLKRASANRYVSLLRHSFYWAIQNGEADKNPVAALNKKMLDEEQAPTRILEPAEQSKLLSAMPGYLRLMTIFALQTAARRGELLALTWEAVHPENVELCETKDSEKRSVRLSRDAKAVLELLRSCEAKAKEFVFEPTVPRKTLISKIRRDWRRAVKNSATSKVRFHDLRHTALTRLVLTGADLRTVKDIAGHSSLKTTQRYLHSSDKLQQAAVERLSGGDFGATFTTTPQEAVEQVSVPATIQ